MPSPGVRAQICVTDYDGDGRSDLVLGDFSRILELRKLEPKERETFDSLEREQIKLIEKQESIVLAKLVEKPDGVKDESPEEKALQKSIEELQKKKTAYFADPETKGRLSSFVWLYVRRSN